MIKEPTRKRSPREAKIEGAVCLWAKSNGISAYKFQSFHMRANPDRIFLLPSSIPGHGVAAFIEFKAPGNTPTLPQRNRMEDLQEQGFRVAWFDKVEPAVEWLQTVMEETREWREGSKDQ